MVAPSTGLCYIIFMALKKKKYGGEWDATLADEWIELVCAKHNKALRAAGLFPDLSHPGEHLLRACRMLFTPAQFTIHRWTEEHAKDFTETDFCITWGAAATSKSNDYGLFLLLDWMVDPADTMVLIGSTTKEALKKRSWESVLRYFNILKASKVIFAPGHSKPSGYSILNDKIDDGDTQMEKAGLFGVALNEGGKLAGAHVKYVRVLVDELATITTEGGRQSIEEAISNLRKGADRFWFGGLANPTSRFDLSGYYAEPLDGWSSVSVDSEVWESRFGRVRHHDGLKSPAIQEPDGARKYPFLINQATIDADRREIGEDSPRFFQMNRGFPAKQGSSATLLTETDLVQGKATDDKLDGMELSNVDAASKFLRTIKTAALDSAFSQGGDSAILQELRVVYLRDLPTLYFPPPEKIPLSDNSERPITYQLTDYVRDWGLKNDVAMDFFAADDSGTQSVCDVLTVEIAPGVTRINYSTSASEEAMSIASPEEAKKKYRDKITEAWAILAEYVKFGQVRGLSEACAKQLVSRQFMTHAKTGVVLEPRRLEQKKIYKSRTMQGSPDEADAAAMAAYLVRHKLGILPGANVYPQAHVPAADVTPPFELSSASTFNPGASADDPLADLMGRYGPDSD